MRRLSITDVPQISNNVTMINQQSGDVELHSFHKIFVFSGTSATIIKNIDGVKNVGEIVEVLGSIYSSKGSAISEDVIRFIQEMIDKKIITYVE